MPSRPFSFTTADLAHRDTPYVARGLTASARISAACDWRRPWYGADLDRGYCIDAPDILPAGSTADPHAGSCTYLTRERGI